MGSGYSAPAEGFAAVVAVQKDLQRQINAIRGAAGLSSAVIGKGGITIKDGGGVDALGGYLRSTNDAGDGAVQMQDSTYYLIPDLSDLSRFGYVRVRRAKTPATTCGFAPPQDPGTSGNPTRFTMRGPGAGLPGYAWLYTDGGIQLNADATIFLTSNDGNIQLNTDAQIDAFADRIQLVSGDGGVGVYGLPMTSDVANVRLATTGGIFTLAMVSSSARYKTDIDDAVVDPADVLSLSGRTWVDKHEMENGPEGDIKRNVGFIAEELDERPSLRQFVDYDEDGRPDAIQYDRLSVALLEVAKDQQSRLEAAEARADAMEARLAALEAAAGI